MTDHSHAYVDQHSRDSAQHEHDMEVIAELRDALRDCDQARRVTPGLVITVHGTPAPQGAIRYGKTGKGYHANGKHLRPWRKAIETVAREQGRDRLLGAVCVEVTVSLPRPGHHYRTGRFATVLRDNAPGWPSQAAKYGADIDHYARACLDALTAADIWHDDVQVVELTARKVYVGSGIDALDRPGAVIRVWSVAS